MRPVWEGACQKQCLPPGPTLVWKTIGGAVLTKTPCLPLDTHSDASWMEADDLPVSFSCFTASWRSAGQLGHKSVSRRLN